MSINAIFVFGMPVSIPEILNRETMEELMQYVWQHRLWNPEGLETNDGKVVKVIDPGLLNHDSGPDFFNAKIKIGEQMWVGNVEMHIRATDWKRHGHDRDKAYDSVILHVVEKDDCPVYRSNGERIPQCVLKVSPHFGERYRRLILQDTELPCASIIPELSKLDIVSWIEALAFERLHSKSDRIAELLDAYSGSWEEVCYVTLARNLGFGINGDAFERLARKTPLNLINKHSDSLIQIEALLLGQAGLLSDDIKENDEYFRHLKTEYAFLANKFSLKPMEGSSWKFFRIRPQNFPYRRIAMLAQLLHEGFRLFTDIIETEDVKKQRELFKIELTGYWSTHFSFGKPSGVNSKALSESAIDIVLINTVAPLLYIYGEKTGNYAMTERAVALLEDIRPERNSIVMHFESHGLKADSALTSQALIQLRREYCESRKCLYCRIGHRLLSKAAIE